MTKKFTLTAKAHVTRSGLPARIVCTDRKHPSGYTVVALYTDSNGNESICCVQKDGKCPHFAGFDLFDAPEKTCTWQSMYRNGVGVPYLSREEAAKVADYNPKRHHIGVLRRDFEDGEFVGAEFIPADKIEEQ